MYRFNQKENKKEILGYSFLNLLVRVISLFIILVLTKDTLANNKDKYSAIPLKVVENFCLLDAQGKRLKGETWQKSIAPLVTWPEEAGDMIFVISDYKIGKAKILDSTATVSVSYRYLGSTDFIKFSEYVKNVEQTRTITFKLVKENGVWKIKEPITAPHVYWKETVSYLRKLQNEEPLRKKQLESIIKKIEKAAKRLNMNRII